MSVTGSGTGLAGRAASGRKLIAIVHIDMVGYSRLIGLDDLGTLERLRALRSTLIDPAVDEHGGRIVQTGGDSLLVVFDSIDGAVRSAVKVQQQIPIHDAVHPPGREIRFRMGIDIGDAIVDGTDIHGNAVNVAARLQAECPPGGICVSRAVRDHVHGSLALEFDTLGALDLKNIAEPVEAYVLRLDDAVTTLGTAGQVFDRGGYDDVPLQGKPAIAVLAFTNMSDDPEQEYFSDGLADDIITELSRSRALFVIARNSSFTYKGRAVNVKQVARELGVRYVIEGSVRRGGDRARVTAQLIDAESGNHVWAERYDIDVHEVFAVQDEITTAVVRAIQPAIADAELRRSMRKAPENLGAWEAYQRGLWHFSEFTPEATAQARKYFHQAMAIDPGFAAPLSGLAFSYIRDAMSHGVLSFVEAAKLVEEAARKGIAIDPNDSEAYANLAFTFAATGNYDAWLDSAEQAVTLNRNSAFAHSVKGGALVWSGRFSEGREEARLSLRLNPRDPISPVIATVITASYYGERDYLATVEAARRCLAQYPSYDHTRRYLVAALGQLGRRREAEAALHDLLSAAPHVVDIMLRNRPPYVREEDHEHLLEGIRKAGWQG